MSAISFVDTNLLVYARDDSEPEKHSAAQAWIRHLWKYEAGRISYQVLNEYYAVVTRKLSKPMPLAAARRDVANLLVWKPVPNSSQLMEQAWRVQDDFMLSWWDALIVAAAQLANCDQLLSEDLQHEMKMGSVIVLNPFLVGPD